MPGTHKHERRPEWRGGATGVFLVPHPDTPRAAVAAIAVEATRPAPGRLTLRYILTGDVSALRLPPSSPQQRTDDLWKHTCFEAFVLCPPGPAYRELNLDPSTRWAAYRFDACRQGMALADIPEPQITVTTSPDRLDLQAMITLDLPPTALWRLGLSAVIEETSGRLSYWALAHPSGRPDFHHADCFTLELPDTDPS